MRQDAHLAALFAPSLNRLRPQIHAHYFRNHEKVRRIEGYVNYWIPLKMRAQKVGGIRKWADSASWGADIDPASGDLSCYRGKSIAQLLGNYDQRTVGLGIFMAGDIESRAKNGNGVCLRDGSLAVVFGPESPGPLTGVEMSHMKISLAIRSLDVAEAKSTADFHKWDMTPYGMMEQTEIGTSTRMIKPRQRIGKTVL